MESSCCYFQEEDLISKKFFTIDYTDIESDFVKCIDLCPSKYISDKKTKFSKDCRIKSEEELFEEESLLQKAIQGETTGLQCLPTGRPVHRFLNLLRRVFSSCEVVGRMGSTSLMVEIRFPQHEIFSIHSKNVQIRRHPTESDVLIFEYFQLIEDKASKLVRHQIVLPEWIDIERVMWRLEENYGLRLVLPLSFGKLQTSQKYFTKECEKSLLPIVIIDHECGKSKCFKKRGICKKTSDMFIY